MLSTRGLPYTPTASTIGLTAEDYREQHEADGEVFRCWHAYDVEGSNRNGKVYEEAELGSIAKCRFRSTEQEIEVLDGSHSVIMPKGSTYISCLPEVVEITEGDFILRSEPGQSKTSRAIITRGSTDTDPLPRRFVTAILKVWVNDVPRDVATVQAVSANSPDNDDLGGIKWLSGAPAEGAKVAVVYRYLRLYSCLGEMIQGQPLGKDGLLLPQRVLLKEERS